MHHHALVVMIDFHCQRSVESPGKEVLKKDYLYQAVLWHSCGNLSQLCSLKWEVKPIVGSNVP